MPGRGRAQTAIVPDASCQPSRGRGGHGIVGFEHTESTEMVLPPVPGGVEETPGGTWAEK